MPFAGIHKPWIMAFSALSSAGEIMRFVAGSTIKGNRDTISILPINLDNP